MLVQEKHRVSVSLRDFVRAFLLVVTSSESLIGYEDPI